MSLKPPEIVDNAYIQIRDLKATNNAYSVGGRFSYVSKDYFFPGYLTSFSDEYTSNFNQQSVYGRMDPINTFQNTQRVISLSFVCPSKDEAEAAFYLSSISALIRSMYPNYASIDTDASKGRNTSIITAPPMFGIRFGNLIQGAWQENAMLKGVIPALTFTPVLEDGMFIGDSGQSFAGGNVSTMYRPKTIEISLTFNPLHDFNMGFDELGNVKGEFAGFPYESKIEQPPSEGIGVLTSEEFNRRQALGAMDQLGDLFGHDIRGGYEQSVTNDILGIS